MSGDPSLDVLLWPSAHLLYRKHNALVESLFVLMPSNRVSKIGPFQIQQRLLLRFLGQFHYSFVDWHQDCDHGGLVVELVSEVNPSSVVVKDGRRGFNCKEIGEGLAAVGGVGLIFTHGCLLVDES